MYSKPYTIRQSHQVLQTAFAAPLPKPLTLPISQIQKFGKSHDFRTINNSNIATHSREQLQNVCSVHENKQMNQSNVRRAPRKPLQYVNEAYNKSFMSAKPLQQKKLTSPMRMFLKGVNLTTISPDTTPQQIKHYSSERPSLFQKQNQTQQVFFTNKHSIQFDDYFPQHQLKSEPTATSSENNLCKSAKSPRFEQMPIITPADENIIEENPYHEDRGDDLEREQGQGSELTYFDSLSSSQGRKRRKSITTFEIQQDDTSSEKENHYISKEEEKKIEDVLARIRKFTCGQIAAAKILKVLVVEQYEEREFHIDIGNIPQVWKMKQLAEVLNKMVSSQLERKLAMKEPRISIVHGRLQTRQLEKDMLVLELIELALKGKLGDDQTIVLSGQL